MQPEGAWCPLERCGHTAWKLRCHSDDSELEALVTHTVTKGARGERSLVRADLLGLWLFPGRQASCSSGSVWCSLGEPGEGCSPPLLSQHPMVAQDHCPPGGRLSLFTASWFSLPSEVFVWLSKLL